MSIGKSLELEVESEDVHELLKSHEIDLNTEELQHLHEERQKPLADDPSSDEDDVQESVLSSLLKEMCSKWGEVQLFVGKYHPDTILTNRAVSVF